VMQRAVHAKGDTKRRESKQRVIICHIALDKN